MLLKILATEGANCSDSIARERKDLLPMLPMRPRSVANRASVSIGGRRAVGARDRPLRKGWNVLVDLRRLSLRISPFHLRLLRRPADWGHGLQCRAYDPGARHPRRIGGDVGIPAIGYCRRRHMGSSYRHDRWFGYGLNIQRATSRHTLESSRGRPMMAAGFHAGRQYRQAPAKRLGAIEAVRSPAIAAELPCLSLLGTSA